MQKKFYKRPHLRISRFFLTLFSSAVPGPLQPPSPPPTPLNTSTRWFYILDFLSVSGIYGAGGGGLRFIFMAQTVYYDCFANTVLTNTYRLFQTPCTSFSVLKAAMIMGHPVLEPIRFNIYNQLEWRFLYTSLTILLISIYNKACFNSKFSYLTKEITKIYGKYCHSTAL